MARWLRAGELDHWRDKARFLYGGSERRPHRASAADNPVYGLRFCENESGFRNSFKFSGGIPLPFDTMFSGLLQVFAGNEILGTYSVDETDIGRPINDSGGDGLIDIPLIEPGTDYEEAITRLDLRFAKVITTGNFRTRLFMDATNLFNSVTVFSRNRFYGSGTSGQNDEFFRPITLNDGRVLAFGLQTSF